MLRALGSALRAKPRADPLPGPAPVIPKTLSFVHTKRFPQSSLPWRTGLSRVLMGFKPSLERPCHFFFSSF